MGEEPTEGCGVSERVDCGVANNIVLKLTYPRPQVEPVPCHDKIQ